MFDDFGNRFWRVISDSPQFLLQSIGNTLLIALIGFVIGLIIASIIAILKIHPTPNRALRIINRIFDIYVLIMRSTPIVVQLLLLYFGLLASSRLPAIIIAIIAFGFNSGAYMSETLRGAINSIDKGQSEAGRAVGMSYGQTARYIILPQAFKVAIPQLGNEIISLIKETAVVGFITVVDITRAMQLIVASTYDAVVPYLVLALVYFVLVVILTIILRLLERRVFSHS
ncbi:MAG: amino acid ABC transporter permease [Firmicutes bacterium]|nr:amino acid ABC transporter permease [Bacillota bacterium]